MRRIQRERDKINYEFSQGIRDLDDDTYQFREGLCRFLLGMSIHLSQVVVSATMAHLLICHEGSRFNFSHNFKNLLLGQMLNHLEGDNPGDFVLKRTNIGANGEKEMWPDYSVNDFSINLSCTSSKMHSLLKE